MTDMLNGKALMSTSKNFLNNFLGQFCSNFQHQKENNRTGGDILEWYVYYENFNAKKIVKWNIFNHYKFKEEVEKLLNRNLSREDFSGKLKDCLLYYFWAKSEYEILISPWLGDAKDIKVDIFDQVMINFERFVDYVWHFSEVENGEK